MAEAHRGGTERVEWKAGHWTHPPVSAYERGSDLVVVAAEGSDAWRHTSYGFVHDTEHALIAPFHEGNAVEVEFSADFSEQFDQAGVFLRASDEHWVKAGVEYADGAAQVSAVVTDRRSDWSASPAPGWVGSRVRVRLSWDGGAVTVRARTDGEWQLVRVFPLRVSGPVAAGPYVCAPTRSGLAITFSDWLIGPPDRSLH